MVGGADDDEQGHQRVQQPQHAPAGPGGRDHAERQHQCPSEVQRGHRGELVGHGVGGGRGPVDGGPVDLRGVDEVRGAEHPGRCEREGEVQCEGGAGQDGEGAPGPQVVAGPAQVQPDQEEDGRREVHGRVVGVRDVHEDVTGPAAAGSVQEQALDRAFAGEGQGALGVPDPARVAEGLVGAVRGEHPARLVDGEQAGDEQQLAYETAPLPGSRAVGRPVGCGVGAHFPRSLFSVLARRPHVGGVDGHAVGVPVCGGRPRPAARTSTRQCIDTFAYRYGGVPIRLRSRTLFPRNHPPRSPEESRSP